MEWSGVLQHHDVGFILEESVTGVNVLVLGKSELRTFRDPARALQHADPCDEIVLVRGGRVHRISDPSFHDAVVAVAHGGRTELLRTQDEHDAITLLEDVGLRTDFLDAFRRHLEFWNNELLRYLVEGLEVREGEEFLQTLSLGFL